MDDLITGGELYAVLFDDGREQLFVDVQKGLLQRSLPIRCLARDEKVAARWIMNHIRWAAGFHMMYYLVRAQGKGVWPEKHPQYFEKENYRVVPVKLTAIL